MVAWLVGVGPTMPIIISVANELVAMAAVHPWALNFASETKAIFCITTEKLKNYLPVNCNKIIVDNVLIATAKITKIFYPDSVSDNFDTTSGETEA